MTYCCGILVRDGLVMIADTRTNAGLDNISTFRKLHLFERPGERVLMLAASGNLSVTQGVVNLIGDGIEHPESGVVENVMNTPNMLHAAQLVGRAVRLSRVQMGNAEGEPAAQGVSFDVSLLLGGQIAGGPLRLFMIYTAGNSIECTPDTNYLQIGEHKYGKPILDRAVTYDTDIYDALKIGLISMDSTMRSKSFGRHADRHRFAASRRAADGGGDQDRFERSVFSRFARELVEGAARGAYGDPQAAVQRPQRVTIVAPADAAAIARAAAILREGGLVAFPTETVYGLGADATQAWAVARIYDAKDRPSFNPLIAHVADLDAARREAALPEPALRLAAAFWPGPLTIVAPIAPGGFVCDLARAGLPSVAVRAPAHPVAQALIAALGRPIAAPSANRSGHVSPVTAAHVAQDLSGKVDMILDGGRTAAGLESTIVSFCKGSPRITAPRRDRAGGDREDPRRKACGSGAG